MVRNLDMDEFNSILTDKSEVATLGAFRNIILIPLQMIVLCGSNNE